MNQYLTIMVGMKSTHSSQSDQSSRSPFIFFALLYILTIPFWILGAATGIDLLPGLPIAALAVVCPMLAALILTYRQNQMAGVKALFRRVLDFKRVHNAWWVAPALLLTPLMAALAFIVQRVTGTGIPDPQLKLVPTLMLFLMFFVGAVAEELGWTGYALDRLQTRWGMLRAALILGVAWAVWHYIPLAQEHRAVEWVAWWTLWTVSARVIMVWLYNRSGKSLFLMVLYHMMSNVVWQLYPVNGSYFDPVVFGIITALVAIGLLGFGCIGSFGRQKA
jgi:membrane protease YdiL (CAAX protease family)